MTLNTVKKMHTVVASGKLIVVPDFGENIELNGGDFEFYAAYRLGHAIGYEAVVCNMKWTVKIEVWIKNNKLNGSPTFVLHECNAVNKLDFKISART